MLHYWETHSTHAAWPTGSQGPPYTKTVHIESTRIGGDDCDIEGVWSFLTYIDLYSTYVHIWRVRK